MGNIGGTPEVDIEDDDEDEEGRPEEDIDVAVDGARIEFMDERC
jgi:hypothetical protein